MKKISIVMILLAQAFFYHACNNENKQSDKAAVLVNESDVDDDAKNFIKAAATGGIMEVELAKEAQKQSTEPAVKDYAAMMISDHTRIYNDLKKLANDKHILLPIELDEEQKIQVKKLQELKGDAFNESYMRMMVTNHEKAIQDYNSGASNRDRQVNKFASEKIDSLKMHLNTARSIFNNLIIKR
jgi:putative membrane protein